MVHPRPGGLAQLPSDLDLSKDSPQVAKYLHGEATPEVQGWGGRHPPGLGEGSKVPMLGNVVEPEEMGSGGQLLT